MIGFGNCRLQEFSPEPLTLGGRIHRHNREVLCADVNHAGGLAVHELDDAVVVRAAFRT
jgi:hypothetical protein